MLYRTLFGLVVVVLGVLAAAPVGAEPRVDASVPDSDRCIAHHTQAQVLRRQGKLLGAGKELQSCLHPACSPLLREACGALLEEVERDTPSVVFAAASEGADLTDVRVFDGEALLLGNITGRAVALDPGVHQLRFEADGKQPLEKSVVLRVGEKNRPVEVTLSSNERPVAPTPSVPVAPPPVAPYVAPGPERARALTFADYAPFGVGVLLGVGGLMVALDARSDFDEAKRTCSPHCTDARQDRILAKSLVADGLFVLTGAVFTYGTIRVLTRGPADSTTAAVIIQPGYVGGRVRF